MGNAKKLMAFIAPVQDVCPICVEELLKYQGAYAIGEELKCWNCGLLFKMDIVDVEEKENIPLDALSMFRLKDGSVHQLGGGNENVCMKNLDIIKVWADLEIFSFSDVNNFFTEKGLDLPKNNKHDFMKNIIVFEKNIGEKITTRIFAPLKYGLVAALNDK